jgi:predicted PolB exonuclease-like 3'-5' exonuclease
MYNRNQLEQILFLDIETASVAPDYSALPETFQQLWQRKAELLNGRAEDEQSPEALYQSRAAIFAEFGKVVCISCGYIQFQDDKPHFKLKSFSGPEEAKVLADFSVTLNRFMQKPERTLCAHNGKEFDFPYLGRRYMINGLPLPGVLADLQNKKPWEIRLVDTMQLWKFGDYKSFTSLDLLCAVFNVPSPKDDIDGSQVGHVFWVEKDHERIARYCERDVVATAQVLLRMSGQPMITAADIVSV